MLKFIDKFKESILVLLLLFLGFLLVKTYIGNIRYKNQLQNYKKEIIQKDSLIKISDGNYEKLVNDFNTSKDIFKKVKEENLELSNQLKDYKSKLISYTKIKTKPIIKDSIIYIDTNKYKDYRQKEFITYFPDKDSFFIKHTLLLEQDKYKYQFSIRTLKLNIVIYEQSEGLYNANIDLPSWLELGSVEVNSLPLKNIKEDNFDWYIGTSFGSNIKLDKLYYDLEGGFRYRKGLYGVGYNNYNSLFISYKHLF